MNAYHSLRRAADLMDDLGLAHGKTLLNWSREVVSLRSRAMGQLLAANDNGAA
jgi:hypothetical protein